MQKNLKMQFIKDFAGKKKGFVGEYSKDNAVILIKNGIAVQCILMLWFHLR